VRRQNHFISIAKTNDAIGLARDTGKSLIIASGGKYYRVNINVQSNAMDGSRCSSSRPVGQSAVASLRPKVGGTARGSPLKVTARPR
jgi:hypothetical protein